MYAKFLCALLLACSAHVCADTISANPVNPESQDSGTLSFDHALHLAQALAPELKAAASAIQAARLDAISAGRLPNPKLAFGIDNVPINSVDRFSFSGESMTMRRIGVMQEFPNARKRAAQKAIAQGEIRVRENLQNSADIALSSNVAGAWLARYSSERQILEVQELRAENQRFADALAAQFAGGKAALVDILAPKIEAAQLDEVDDGLQAQRLVAIASLKRWLGDRANAPLQGSPPHWLRISTAQLAPANQQWRGTVDQHPALIGLHAQLNVADARIAVARADKRPDWALELVYQERSRPFSDMVSLQFSVDLPIFAGRRIDPSIAARASERAALAAETDAATRERQANLDAQLAQLARLTQAFARQNDTLVPLAQEKMRLSTAEWSAGSGNLRDLMIARREGLLAKLRAIELDTERMQAIAALHYSYGTVGRLGAAP